MPEASINEYSEPLTREHHIGFAAKVQQGMPVLSEPEPSAVESGAEGYLDCCVFPTIGLHRFPYAARTGPRRGAWGLDCLDSAVRRDADARLQGTTCDITEATTIKTDPITREQARRWFWVQGYSSSK
jgi:hypothetical protein